MKRMSEALDLSFAWKLRLLPRRRWNSPLVASPGAAAFALPTSAPEDYFQKSAGIARNATGQAFSAVSRSISALITISQPSGEPPLIHCSSSCFKPSTEIINGVMPFG